MNQERDILAKAIEQLRREGLSGQVPQSVIDETVRRLAATGPGIAGYGPQDHSRAHRSRIAIGLALSAAALIVLGCVIGRLSGPAPVNVDELRQALTTSVAASIEPTIRARVVEDMQQRYQLALAATYVKVKEELTQQYRDDLNRFAMQTLAASNAETNRLLAELVANIDTAQAQDLAKVARALYQIEQSRIQDRTQLAAGLHTLANRAESTENELSRTRRQFVQLLADVRPEEPGMQSDRPIEIPQ